MPGIWIGWGLSMEDRVLAQVATQPAVSGVALLAAIGMAALILRRPVPG